MRGGGSAEGPSTPRPNDPPSPLNNPSAQESGLQWLPAVGPSGQNVTAPPSEPWLAAWWRKGSGGNVGGFGADSRPTVLGAIDAFSPRDRALGALGGGERVSGEETWERMGLGRGRAFCTLLASVPSRKHPPPLPPQFRSPQFRAPSPHVAPPSPCLPPLPPFTRQAAAAARHRPRHDTGGGLGTGLETQAPYPPAPPPPYPPYRQAAAAARHRRRQDAGGCTGAGGQVGGRRTAGWVSRRPGAGGTRGRHRQSTWTDRWVCRGGGRGRGEAGEV